MYKITFKLRSAAQNKKTGEAPVSLVYRYEETELVRATGVSSKPQWFDAAKGRVKSADPHAGVKNEQIAALTAKVERAAKASFKEHGLYEADAVAWWITNHETIEKELTENLIPALRRDLNTDLEKTRDRIEALEAELAEERVNLRWLLLGVPGESEKGPIDFFTARITEFLARRGVTYTPATKRLYENVGDLVKEWNPRLDITEVNLKVLNSFQNWLVEVKGCKNGSVNTYVTKFKAVLNEFADELGINLAFYKKFKPLADLANENIIILSDEEIAEIEAMDVSRWEVMSAVREQFVFCYETGLRHSDLNKVRLGAVEDMPEGDGRRVGHKRLRIATKKGKKQIIVPLTPRALDILERNAYTFQPYKLRNFNQALESIARRCKTLQYEFTRTHYVGSEEAPETKLKCEFVTSHAGRRSFINNALLRGVSESTVATWVGHSDVKMIQQHYSHREMQAQAEAHKILV